MTDEIVIFLQDEQVQFIKAMLQDNQDPVAQSTLRAIKESEQLN